MHNMASLCGKPVLRMLKETGIYCSDMSTVRIRSSFIDGLRSVQPSVLRAHTFVFPTCFTHDNVMFSPRLRWYDFHISTPPIITTKMKGL